MAQRTPQKGPLPSKTEIFPLPATMPSGGPTRQAKARPAVSLAGSPAFQISPRTTAGFSAIQEAGAKLHGLRMLTGRPAKSVSLRVTKV